MFLSKFHQDGSGNVERLVESEAMICESEAGKSFE